MGHFEECPRENCYEGMICLDWQHGTFYFCPSCGTIQVTNDLKCGDTRRMSRESMEALVDVITSKRWYRERK